MFRYIAFLFAFVFLSSFSSTTNDTIFEEGSVIYSFESGKMQCLSEVNLQGNVTVLLKNLDKYTQVKFNKVEKTNRNKYVVVVTMIVEEENPICARWVNLQEVKIVLNPKFVEKTTLSGKTIYTKNNISVLIP